MTRRELSSQFLDRSSIVIPFVIIAIAVGVLSYRSYQLAVRMESGIHSFAVEYLHYAAEIAAERADTALHEQFFRAAEEWQKVERTVDGPTSTTLREWIRVHPWIVSAIYIPDENPVNSVYFTEALEESDEEPLTHELFSATGTVRYTFLPSRLIAYGRRAIEDRQDIHTISLAETAEIRRRSRIELLLRDTAPIEPVEERTVLSALVPLSEPLSMYGVRAAIDDPYVGAGWENHRVVSLWLAVIALTLVLVAVLMASHGLKREAETIHLRAALIANVSHELRTPLSMIRLGAETLRRTPRLDETQRDVIQESIHREAMHLSHLVENVLDVARMQKSGIRLVLAPVDPADLVGSLVASYEPWLTSKGFRAELKVDDDIGEQMWDREAISRALLNLIDNAVKYSAEEKLLTIRLRNRPDRIEIEAQDRGIGLRQRDVGRIFEPYFRAEFSDTETRRGAGLGLTLVHEIVRAHGGRIEVNSTRGEGSTFTMVFPKPRTARLRTSDGVESARHSLAPESGESK